MFRFKRTATFAFNQSMRANASNNKLVLSSSSSYVFNAQQRPLSSSPEKLIPKYWNRESYAFKKKRYDYLIRVSPESIQKEARILSLSEPGDDADAALQDLPYGATLLAEGTSMDDFSHLLPLESSSHSPNVLFVSPSCLQSRELLPVVLKTFPSIEWIHCRSAGIDFVYSNEFASLTVPVTNAKGQFSSSLAEYTMMACSYFAKDLPRLLRQKDQKVWGKYDVEELRGKTMGIVGYGDIGQSCAKLANIYGMKIIALRRNPKISENDPLCDIVYGTGQDSLNRLMSESDYVVCSAPSTNETKGMVDAVAIGSMRSNGVLINLGRGHVLDELALVDALKENRIRGAALDVFIEEPLPAEHELWNQDNVLISPHNMDQTCTFMHEATEFFVFENLPRFMCGKTLLNPVDKILGY